MIRKPSEFLTLNWTAKKVAKMKLEHFFGVDLTDAPVPTAQEKMPRKEGKYIVTLASLVNWAMTGLLHIYDNNRGDGKVSKQTSDSTAAGINKNAIGEFQIGMYSGDEVSRITIANGHSRLGGIFQRLASGELTQKELEMSVYVTFLEEGEFMRTYQMVNASTSHKNKDKIKNPDLAFGPTMKKLRDGVGETCMSLIGNNKWTVLSSIIFNLTTPNRSWLWPEVYQKRMPASAMANELAGELKIATADHKRLIGAVQFWFELMDGLREKAKESGVDVSKIVSNAGMFGYIVCDQMKTVPELSTPPILIKKMIRHLPTILLACPELCRGNRPMILQKTFELDDIFKRRTKEAA